MDKPTNTILNHEMPVSIYQFTNGRLRVLTDGTDHATNEIPIPILRLTIDELQLTDARTDRTDGLTRFAIIFEQTTRGTSTN